MSHLNTFWTKLIYVLLLMSPSVTTFSQQLAFPGAEGGGKFSTGGRGGTIYEVTNLNDSGAGSLRDAVSQSNRIVVFRVSGIIHLNSRLSISKNNITIAGQTAPGDGICLTGQNVNIKASNIIIRHIRCRLSDVNDVEDDAMNSFSGPYENIIIDHCSLSWSVDETGTFYGIKDFTLQWCMLSESLYRSVHDKGNHGYGGIWGGNNATFHHNLLAHHTSRNPRFGGSRYTGKPEEEIVDFRNNVIYNWGNGNSVYGGEAGNYNMVNNYYKPGPATPGNTTTSSTSNKRNRILHYTSYYYGSDAAIYPDTVFGGKFYIDGNYVDGYPDVTIDNWTKGVQKDSYKNAEQLIAAARQSVPFSTAPVTTQSAEEAYLTVLQNVGATKPKRDPIDVRIINETQSGTATFEGVAYGAINGTGISHPSGIIDSQTDVGGLPAYHSTPAPTDTDHDGMPDEWEISMSLNPNDASDRNLIGAGGYTNVEIYLNSIAENEPTLLMEGTFASFVQEQGSPSGVQNYSLKGVNLTGDVVITPPADFEISSDGGSTWHTNASPLTLAQSNGVVLETALSVRLNASSVGSHFGDLVHATNGITNVVLSLTGITTLVSQTPVAVSVTVAKDGTGDFTAVQAAVDAAPVNRTTPYIIYIKNGIYKEKISIPSNKPFLQFVGESVANTILTFDDYSGKPMPGGGTFGTSNSASVIVNANDFTAVNITFQNTTGDAPQALAINVNGDRAAFQNCRFLGGQDTLLTNGSGKKQYYRYCYIDGVVDFIFGGARAVFDSCVVYAKSRKDGLNGSYITAANTQPDQEYGYVFRHSAFPSNTGVTKYVLGRPWQNSATSDPKSYPKVVLINPVYGNNLIKPEGWSVWDAGTDVNSIYYAEYNSLKFNGTPIDVSQRVSWSFQLTAAEAATYTNEMLFDTWNPCNVYPGICGAAPNPIAVSNFEGKKGTTTSLISWNISWPIKDVKYELFRSEDNSSFSKIHEQISPNDSSINYSYTDNNPPPGVTYYYQLIASKSGKNPHLTSIITISSTPTISVVGSLDDFLQGLGEPSPVQVYKISGENLLDEITITPPANFEVSDDGITWHSANDPLLLESSAGAVPDISISVRLNASLAGNYSGNIVQSSMGASTVQLYVKGTAQSDALPESKVLLFWPMKTNNSDDPASRDDGVESGVNSMKKLFVSNGTTVSGVPDYSEKYGQAFSPSAGGDGLWTTASGGPGGNLSRAYYMQYTIKSASRYATRVDSIIFNASFYNTSSNTKLAIVYSKSGFTTADSTDVSGGNGPGGPLVSTANGAFATPVFLNNETAGTTNNYRFALAGATGVTVAPSGSLTIRLYFSCGSTSTGRYAKIKDVYIKGLTTESIDPPVITTSGTLSTFNQSIGAPSNSQSYMVTAQHLSGNLTITPPVPFEVSGDGGINWSTSLSPLQLIPSGGAIPSTTISVRLNASSANTYSGSIVHESPGATTKNIIVSGVASEVTAISDNVNNLFTLSPNPTKDFVVINHASKSPDRVFSLYSVDGMKVKTMIYNSPDETTVVDIRGLSPGVYIAECKSNSRQQRIRLIILQ